jgi:hypothetical protein
MSFWEGPRSGTNHFWLEVGFIRFSPSACFLGTTQVQFAPFSVRLWNDGLSFCPVETVRLILQGRVRLHLAQNAIFFSWMRLLVLLDAAAFNRCILRCLLQAGIQATFGSTGLVSASAALVCDAPLGAVPRLCDRGSAPALFRFCHALCGLVGSHDVP